MKLIGVMLLALGGCCAAAFAATDPADTVREASDQILLRLQADAELIEADPGHVVGIIEELLIPKIDMPGVARLVLSEHWDEASEAQREQFTEEFRKYMVRFYARVFCQYAGEDLQVDYTPPATSVDGHVAAVESKITPTGGECTYVNYRMRETPSGWKVIDVVIDGVSLVKSNRSQFDSLIRRDGMDAVIARMVERNARPFR